MLLCRIHLFMQLSVFNIGRILRGLSYSIKAYANLPHLNERKKYLLSVKNCLCQNRNMFPTCQGNVVHTTASLPHFTVPTGARLTRNIAQLSAVRALCDRCTVGWPLCCPVLVRTPGVAFANSRPAPCANSFLRRNKGLFEGWTCTLRHTHR